MPIGYLLLIIIFERWSPWDSRLLYVLPNPSPFLCVSYQFTYPNVPDSINLLICFTILCESEQKENIILGSHSIFIKTWCYSAQMLMTLAAEHLRRPIHEFYPLNFRVIPRSNYILTFHPIPLFSIFKWHLACSIPARIQTNCRQIVSATVEC